MTLCWQWVLGRTNTHASSLTQESRVWCANGGSRHAACQNYLLCAICWKSLRSGRRMWYTQKCNPPPSHTHTHTNTNTRCLAVFEKCWLKGPTSLISYILCTIPFSGSTGRQFFTGLSLHGWEARFGNFATCYAVCITRWHCPGWMITQFVV